MFSRNQEVIGSYVLDKKVLGVGAFGKVKLGFHIHSDQEVAVKVFSKAKMKNKSTLIKFNRERKILNKLNHPNICKLYEVTR